MGIVGKVYMAVVTYLKVESSVHTMVCFHSKLQLVSGATIQLSHRHCRYSIFNINWHGLPKLYAFYTFNGRNKVESNFSVFNDDILCVEVASITTISIGLYTFLNVGFHL